MKRLLVVVVPVVILAGLIGWRINQKKAEAAQQVQQRQARMKAAPVVAVATAQVRDIVHTYQNVGSVESPFNVKLSPKVTGRIDYLEVREGARVTRGQVLVRIDPSEIQAQVAAAQAAVAQARSKLAEAKITQAPTNVSVSTNIQQQQAAVNSAEADYNQTRENYKSQVAAAQASVTDAQGRVNSANAGIENAQASIRSAQANLLNANTKFQRIDDLYKQGFTAAQDVDDARATVAVQQGALDVANGQLGSAKAQHDSALAQLNSAQQELSIAKTSGQANIAASKAKLVQAQAALKYAKANRAQTPAYQQNLAALQYAVDAAEGQLRNAQAQLANTVLTSPIDGYVTARYMDPGATATPGQPILAIQELNSVWFTVPVTEEASRHIYQGQEASVEVDALPGQTFRGAVTQVNPSADPTSRQFQIRITLPNPQHKLKPGMFGRATFVTDRVSNVVVVPREAIQQGKGGGTQVTVVGDDMVAHVVPVVTGAEDTNGVQIQSGVKAGDKVVTMSMAPVKDGQTVKLGGAGHGIKGAGSGAPGGAPAGMNAGAR